MSPNNPVALAGCPHDREGGSLVVLVLDCSGKTAGWLERWFRPGRQTGDFSTFWTETAMPNPHLPLEIPDHIVDLFHDA